MLHLADMTCISRSTLGLTLQAAGSAGSSGQVRRGCALLVLERLIHVVTEPLFLRPVTTSLLAGIAAKASPGHQTSPTFREPAARQVRPALPNGTKAARRPLYCQLT